MNDKPTLDFTYVQDTPRDSLDTDRGTSFATEYQIHSPELYPIRPNWQSQCWNDDANDWNVGQNIQTGTVIPEPTVSVPLFDSIGSFEEQPNWTWDPNDQLFYPQQLVHYPTNFNYFPSYSNGFLSTYHSRRHLCLLKNLIKSCCLYNILHYGSINRISLL